MAVIDSYSETNQNAVTPLGSDAGNNPSGLAGGYGMCFTGDGEKITDSKWYLSKTGGPTGNAVAKIWTMTGTFGTNGVPGTLLATSDNVLVSTVTGSLSLITFPFSGANQYVTTNGTRYVSTVEYGTADSNNYLNLGYDSTGTHPGTWVYHAQGTSGAWSPVDAGIDLIFYVDGVAVAVDVTVNLTGVGASPAIGTGTVTIGSPVTPPPVDTGGGGTGRSGMRLRPSEDIRLYLEGVAANPKVGTVVPLNDMARVYEGYLAPARARKPAEMPPGMRRVFEKPIPPSIFVYPTPFPKLKSAVGTGKVTAYFEDIDEELMALVGIL